MTRLLLERRAHSTWWTRDEVVSFAQQLTALDSKVAQAFTDTVVQKDPAMRGMLAGGRH